jgi:hypothetical protein
MSTGRRSPESFIVRERKVSMLQERRAGRVNCPLGRGRTQHSGVHPGFRPLPVRRRGAGGPAGAGEGGNTVLAHLMQPAPAGIPPGEMRIHLGEKHSLTCADRWDPGMTPRSSVLPTTMPCCWSIRASRGLVAGRRRCLAALLTLGSQLRQLSWFDPDAVSQGPLI